MLFIEAYVMNSTTGRILVDLKILVKLRGCLGERNAPGGNKIIFTNIDLAPEK